VFGHPGRIDAFARLSNLTNHANVLGYTRSTETASLHPIPMMPLTALAAGIDWGF
jgi:hypothetical protein